MFLNIGQTTGVAVVISVGTFIERFDALATGTEEEKAAHALLVSRGFDERTVKQAKDLLDELRSVEPMPVPNPEEMKRKQAEADAALWGWYKQWGAIARVAIKRGDYLRQLGFGGLSGSPTPEPDLNIDVDPSPPAD